jgi:hypothetical protein
LSHTYRPNDSASGELREESARIARALNEAQPSFTFKVLYAAPDKTWAGMGVVADGTTWNPDSGFGFYIRNAANSAWVQLATTDGTTTNDNANAGNVGEFQTNTTASTALTSGAVANAASLSLTAGDWDVQGVVQINPSAGTLLTIIIPGVSTVSATRPAFQQEVVQQFAFGELAQVVATPVVRVSIASTTTVYLTMLVVYTGGTGVTAAPGYLRARRVR